jgi:hypothetical protein
MQGHSIPYGATEVDVAFLAGGDKVLATDPPKAGQIRSGTYDANTQFDSPKSWGALQAIYYGWLAEPTAQIGMGRLLVDSLIKMPVSSSPTVVRPPLIQRSAYEQIAHYRHQQDLNLLSRQQGLRDDAMTRYSEFEVDAQGNSTTPRGPRVKTSGQAGYRGPVQPSGATSMPPIEHSLYSAAWRVPRFSTEPFTILPQSSP